MPLSALLLWRCGVAMRWGGYSALNTGTPAAGLN